MNAIKSTLITLMLTLTLIHVTSAQCSATSCNQCRSKDQCEAITNDACRWSSAVCVSQSCDTTCEDCFTIIECLASIAPGGCTVDLNEDCIGNAVTTYAPPINDPTLPPSPYQTTRTPYPTRDIMTTEGEMYTTDSASDSDSDSISSDSSNSISSDSSDSVSSDSMTETTADSADTSDQDSNDDSSTDSGSNDMDSSDKSDNMNGKGSGDSTNGKDSGSVSSEGASESNESKTSESDDGTDSGMSERRTAKDSDEETHRSNVQGFDGDEYGENETMDNANDSTKIVSLTVVGITCVCIVIGLVIGGCCFYGKKAKSHRFGQPTRVAVSDVDESEEEEEDVEEVTECTVMVAE